MSQPSRRKSRKQKLPAKRIRLDKYKKRLKKLKKVEESAKVLAQPVDII